MYSEQTANSFYGKNVARLSVLTVLFGFGSILLGYIFMPFAAAFFAALLTYEKKHRRIASFIIPICILVLNFAFNGIYSMEGISFVVLGIVIYFSYSKGLSKGEAVFYASLATAILFVFSILLLAFEKIGGIKFSMLSEYFSELYYQYKDLFLSVFTNLIGKTEDGIYYYLLNADSAEIIYQSMILTLVPLLVSLAFILSGIAFKVFTSCVKRYLGDETGILQWSFGLSNLIAYFYIVVAILAILSRGSSDIFGLTIAALSSVFSIIFGYLGIRFVFRLVESKRSTFFAIAVVVLFFLLFSNYAVSLLSYIGVYYTIITNKRVAKRD